jgi:hypothetical protein
MSLRSLNRRLDRLEKRLPVRHATIWAYLRGLASFDDLDEGSKETLRQAVADCTDPLERIEHLIHAPLKGADGSRPCRSQAATVIRTEPS